MLRRKVETAEEGPCGYTGIERFCSLLPFLDDLLEG